MPTHHDYYEINIAHNGKHFFATDERSVTSFPDLEFILPILIRKFPESEGYRVTVTRWTTSGRELDYPIIRARALAGGVK